MKTIKLVGSEGDKANTTYWVVAECPISSAYSVNNDMYFKIPDNMFELLKKTGLKYEKTD